MGNKTPQKGMSGKPQERTNPSKETKNGKSSSLLREWGGAGGGEEAEPAEIIKRKRE